MITRAQSLQPEAGVIQVACSCDRTMHVSWDYFVACSSAERGTTGVQIEPSATMPAETHLEENGAGRSTYHPSGWRADKKVSTRDVSNSELKTLKCLEEER